MYISIHLPYLGVTVSLESIPWVIYRCALPILILDYKRKVVHLGENSQRTGKGLTRDQGGESNEQPGGAGVALSR